MNGLVFISTKGVCEDPVMRFAHWTDAPISNSNDTHEEVKTQRRMVCKVLGESDRETNSLHLFFLSADMRCSVVCFLSSAVTLHNTPQLDVVTFGQRKQHRHCQSRIQTHKNYVLQHRLALNNCPAKGKVNEARSTNQTPAHDKEERSVDNQSLRQCCSTVQGQQLSKCTMYETNCSCSDQRHHTPKL